MSFSVDDLVSSLSSNHIGQEAIDLATLQAQLAETLAGGHCRGGSTYHAHDTQTRQTSFSTRGRSQRTQPSNTPTVRTPSSSSLHHAWGMDTTPHGRGRANSISSTYLDETEEDERMVEDLLIPLSAPLSDPATPSPQFEQELPSSSSSASQAHITLPYQINTNPFPSYSYASDPAASSPTTSLFATTDPFYIAQLQAASQQHAQSQSVFAQNGRLTQNSPFALPTQYHQFHVQSQWDGVGAMSMTSMPATTCATAF
ncbi:hypothetical protein GALMADRAFT_231333 [Galerina marginata CBS 339.88]|uniref:Uncharacterized protein n=1 Tax=Galerina marginata (strain CBS 339.88) TaxID=685588 RepID=A0A067SNM5_GALM3|nr:hypothetical protein GALMADRAFT_231333 [Galerina marginata CBS 339.88]